MEYLLANAHRLRQTQWVDGVGLRTSDDTATLNGDEEKEKRSQQRKMTTAVNLQKLLVNKKHVTLIRGAVERAHHATRLASRLLTFHALKCLERDLPIPAFGDYGFAVKAWHCITQASRVSHMYQPDAGLLATFKEFMAAETPVDSAKLTAVMQFEAHQWAVCFSNNVYVHFASHVKKFVNTAFHIDKTAMKALDKAARMQRKTELTKVAYDLCSPTGADWKSPDSYHEFIRATRLQWRLDDFPWDGCPLAYHLKANDPKKPEKCHAHLLLPALWQMRIHRQQHEQKGFALLPLRTQLVPRHTHFGSETLRSLLGVGGSEYKKAMEKERRDARKRQKLGTDAAGTSSSNMEVVIEHDKEEKEEETVQKKKKRKRRPPTEVAAEKQKDLLKLFDLKKAGVHDVKGKTFDCTFTSDGVAAHLQFTWERGKHTESKDDGKLPRRGIFDIDDLKARLDAKGITPATNESVDNAKSPKSKLEKLCICCDGVFRDPIPGFVCVGCDPGRNEPVCMVEPISGEKLRMTATGRRHACNSPGKWERTARHVRQSIRKCKCAEHARIEASAKGYRTKFEDKPTEINRLECELGTQGCSTGPYLTDFSTYVDALKQHEAILMPHYSQLHHRQLRRKTRIETQRFESKFIRDIKRTFNPERADKTIILAWGCWGKIAGRANGVGNKGRPSTIGVGLARRIAKEEGIVVAWTPEHYTTKTHFNCGGKCCRFTKAEQRRAEDRTRRSHGDEVFEAKEIRGLKVCQNPECNAPVNRDLNASKNIAANGILLLTGHVPIHEHTPEEAELTILENDMHSA